jgi:DNA-binding transcriptional ArsR family regulator
MTSRERTLLVPETLQKVEATLRDNFEIKDWRGVSILLGVAAAHYLPGEPLWLRLIGASRSGRTELLRAFLQDEDSIEMESLTPASIRGGFKGAERLLDRINGKRVITKDLAPLITTRKETRLEIFGLLRSVKDGSISADFGTFEGHVYQEIKFDWILAVTPVIESVRQIESLLGERYIDLRWIPGNRQTMAYKAAMNNPRLSEIREQLSKDVCSLLATAKGEAKERTIELCEQEKVVIAKYADVVALCRSPIQKDSRGNILVIPKPEIGTSLAQDFCRVALGLKLIGIDKWPRYIERLAWDCIPSVRATILKALWDKSRSVQQLHEKTGIPTSTIYYHLSDLQVLKVVKDEAPQAQLKNGIPIINMAEDDPAVKKRVAVDLPPVPKKRRRHA